MKRSLSRQLLSGRLLTKRTAARRGFTLVELMIALAAGIAVSGAAYVLSQTSLDVFRQEERLASAQSSATLGMNRMLNDIQRAGFMMSPNINHDTAKQCGAITSYTNLVGVKVLSKGSGSSAPAGGTGNPAAASVYNGLHNGIGTDPDRIRIAGNFSSTEQFEFRQIDSGTVYIAFDRGSMQRTLQQADYGGPSLHQIFRPNRWVRIVDATGHENYRQISSIDCSGTPCLAATATSMTIALVTPPTSTESCGPGVTRGLINPVSIVDYWIGQPIAGDLIAPDALDAIAPVKPLATGDASRTELLRTEYWDHNGALEPLPVDNSDYPTEVVAEYAVDLAIGATFRATVGTEPTLSRVGFRDSLIQTTTNNFPERFVSLTVRLTTRARVADRQTPAPGDALSRFAVFKAYPATAPVASFGTGNAQTTNLFARTRSLTAEVNLPNIAGSQW